MVPLISAEIAKLIEAYIWAYKAAELDDRVAGVEQLARAELMCIAAGGLVDPDQLTFELLSLNPLGGVDVIVAQDSGFL